MDLKDMYHDIGEYATTKFGMDYAFDEHSQLVIWKVGHFFEDDE